MPPRVQHFAIFENLVFAITSKMLRIRTGHIKTVCSLDSKLLLISICSIRILNILEVIAKTSFSKSAKCSTLCQDHDGTGETRADSLLKGLETVEFS